MCVYMRRKEGGGDGVGGAGGKEGESGERGIGGGGREECTGGTKMGNEEERRKINQTGRVRKARGIKGREKK